MDRGALIAAFTEKSECMGFFEGYYPKANVPFIVLASTKKLHQGKAGDHWYDHTYSIPIERIISIKRLTIGLI
jgi:hypothetical protein